jgi:hypothetical protein
MSAAGDVADHRGRGLGTAMTCAAKDAVGDADELASAPNRVGVSVAEFNPDRDPGGAHAERVVEAPRSTFRR